MYEIGYLTVDRGKRINALKRLLKSAGVEQCCGFGVGFVKSFLAFEAGFSGCCCIQSARELWFARIGGQPLLQHANRTDMLVRIDQLGRLIHDSLDAFAALFRFQLGLRVGKQFRHRARLREKCAGRLQPLDGFCQPVTGDQFLGGGQLGVQQTSALPGGFLARGARAQLRDLIRLSLLLLDLSQNAERFVELFQ